MSETVTGAFGAAHGWPSLPWVEEPARAGWWVWWDGKQQPEIYLIKIEDTPLTKGAFYYHKGRSRWESCGFKNWLAMGVSGGWAGPVELPQAPVEEPTANEKLSGSAARSDAEIGGKP